MAVYIALLGYAQSVIFGVITYHVIGNVVLSHVVCAVLSQICGMLVMYKLTVGKWR